jgi:hypothetical protein
MPSERSVTMQDIDEDNFSNPSIDMPSERILNSSNDTIGERSVTMQDIDDSDQGGFTLGFFDYYSVYLPPFLMNNTSRPDSRLIGAPLVI